MNLAIFPRFARRQDNVTLPGTNTTDLSNHSRQKPDFER
jgi:hypothetical protein